MKTIAILASDPGELRFFEKRLPIQGEEKRGFALFQWGTLGSTRVLLGALGIGKVCAAAGTQAAIDHYQPQAILMVGASGSLRSELGRGDVILATSVKDRDVGYLTAEGLNPGGLRVYDAQGEVQIRGVAADPDLLALAQGVAHRIPWVQLERAPRLHQGVVVTGDSFLASRQEKERLVQVYDASAVEMEGVGAAQTAWAHRVPFLMIRAISDHADDQVSLDLSNLVVYEDQYQIESRPSRGVSDELAEDFNRAGLNAAGLAWEMVQELAGVHQ